MNYHTHIKNALPSDWLFNTENEDRFKNLTIKPKGFIEEYIIKSGKKRLIEVGDDLFNTDNNTRLAHTHSVFFLGALVYKHTILNKTAFKGYSNKNAEFELFPFLWFLTSLFHDSKFDDEINAEMRVIKDNISDFLIENDIKYIINKENNFSEHAPFHLIDSLDAYFKYRKGENRKDHGISAGFLLYDRLVKNRKTQNKKNPESIYWKEELDKYYLEASTVIATHNIWLPKIGDCKTIKKYLDHDLCELVKNINYKISHKDYPLLFLLGLVDTIDPVKLYSCVTPDYVLKNIDIDFPNSKHEISISLSEGSSLDITKLHKLKDSLSWLAVEVDTNNNGIFITFLN